jgi:hypothetical protein
VVDSGVLLDEYSRDIVAEAAADDDEGEEEERRFFSKGLLLPVVVVRALVCDTASRQNASAVGRDSVIMSNSNDTLGQSSRCNFISGTIHR